MRLWLARNSEIPLREQLVAQVVLSILSGTLPAGHRLPSTRELARRHKVHLNTVSAAYRELERSEWVEFRRGSGVYVRKHSPAQMPPRLALDRLIGEFFHSARELGASLTQVRARLRHWLALQPPDHFLLIEPDEELRRIILAEISAAVKFRVEGAGFDACRQPEALAAALPLALASKFEKVRGMLPAGAECISLQVRAIPDLLATRMPIPQDALIAVASRWPDFLKWARAMFLAAGVQSDALVLRDARRPRWHDGLREASIVVADVLTAKQAPRGCNVYPFPLIADASLESLREYAKFLSGSTPARTPAK